MTDLSKKYRYTKLACYFTGFSMSAASNLSAILFVPFREIYGISFTKLGFLVLVNFCTQLFIDLVFTFFSNHFNLNKTIKSIPLVVLSGMLVYTFVPMVFPEHTYIALVIGTLIFSLGAGLGEVLTSPVIAAIPADNPEGEMSKLHSAYAWGVVGVVIVSTVMLKIIGEHNWFYLSLLWCLLPLISFLFFLRSEIPALDLNGEGTDNSKASNRFGIMLCTACIFFGGAAEMSMTQWVSGFAEKALNIDKVYGDIFGMALFALTLGLGRTLYAKKGKNIYKALLYGMGISCICYVVAAVSSSSIVGLIACVLTGFSTSMLWPGTIIYINEKYVSCGVGVYALLAAGGDLGASISPQLLGFVADKMAESKYAADISLSMGMSADQIGMKAGMLIAAAFPFFGVLLWMLTKRYFDKKEKDAVA